MTRNNLDTNDRTAPTPVWNAYHAARKDRTMSHILGVMNITADRLRYWTAIDLNEQLDIHWTLRA